MGGPQASPRKFVTQGSAPLTLLAPLTYRLFFYISIHIHIVFFVYIYMYTYRLFYLYVSMGLYTVDSGCC